MKIDFSTLVAARASLCTRFFPITHVFRKELNYCKMVKIVPGSKGCVAPRDSCVQLIPLKATNGALILTDWRQLEGVLSRVKVKLYLHKLLATPINIIRSLQKYQMKALFLSFLFLNFTKKSYGKTINYFLLFLDLISKMLIFSILYFSH